MTPGVLALRRAGFIVTVAGALLTGLGSLIAWAQVGIEGVPLDVISPTHLGVDLIEGKITIGLAVVAVVCVLLARVGREGARAWAATVVFVAGIGILLTSGEIALFGSDRLEAEAVDHLRAAAGEQADDRFIDDIVRLVESRLGSGVWLTMAGGAVVTVGGTLAMAWARRVLASRDAGAPLEGSDT
jgi:hypothetical protein